MWYIVFRVWLIRDHCLLRVIDGTQIPRVRNTNQHFVLRIC